MKKSNPVKNLLGYIPVAVLGVGLIGGWFNFTAMAENTKVKVEKLESKVEEVVDENNTLEKSIEVNKAQQDNIQREVQQITDKTDKIYEALISMSKKK